MGRDLIAKIPCFTNPIEELRIQVNKYSENLLSCADQILSRSEDEPEIIQSKVEEGDIIIFPGFQDNRPTLVEYQGKAQVKEIETEIKSMSEENRVRSTIQAKLEECAAGKVTDIDIERNRHMEFNIRLINPNQRPIYCKSRPIPQSIKEMVRVALFEQLEAGLIRHSTSKWASPLHIVIKTDGSIRITVDYKLLNNVIEFDPYPMPSTKDIYNELRDSSWFSKFDFYKAYNQIPVATDSIELTAFICEWGLFECPSMPQGIKTAAAWFQRCMDIVFVKLVQSKVLKTFLDDIVLHSPTLEKHLEAALQLVETMKTGTLRISLKKCELVKEEITFLG